MRLLFVTSTRIGDAVLSTAILALMLRRFPDIRVTVACGPEAAPLFGSVPNLDKVIVVRKQKYRLHWLKLWAGCAFRYWHEIIDLRGSGLAYCLLAGNRRVAGRGDETAHRLDQWAQGLGLGEIPNPLLWTSVDHDRRALDLLGKGPPVIAIAPTANWRGKLWPTRNFIELIQRLTGPNGILPGARVAVIAGPGERERTVAEPVLISIPVERRVDVVGKADLLTVFALLRRCAFFIGNDSGIMHLAAASGAPTLGLFGPSRVEHYAPRGLFTAVARTPIPYEDLVGQPGYDHRKTGSLMESLAVDTVEAAARDLWARCRDRSA